MPVNPSAALARRLGTLPRLRLALGQPPRVLELRTRYDAIPETFVPALAERPVAVLMFGVAASAQRLRVEMRGRNRASRLFPDASGTRPARLTLDADGPAERRSSVAAAARAVLRRHGVPAAASRDAGRYLCNASYYRALAEACPVLFLHIPPRAPPHARVRRPAQGRAATDSERLLRALTGIAAMLARRGRGGH
ncbi:peptidase C15 [Methylobacterium planeticum]|uniref:Peptidase C15 n=2 Tax=Methylobacterium planeticum TaxID=2615211 RepID=A0A6N6MVF9_9HYPH|nr:peptidase C15 [Methylobacterium planeticum]